VSQAVATSAATKEFTLWQRVHGWITNPWGKPRFLVLITWGYMVWAIAPVLIAIQFSFNDSRSLTVWHGFTTKWYFSDPIDSIWHNASYRGALNQSLKLAAIDVLIATPIGVMLALGLARWRGRGSGASNFLMLFPLVTPEIVMGVSLLLLFTQLFTFVNTGTLAQVLGRTRRRRPTWARRRGRRYGWC
jgi:spermidine/putrescine transport system permease protein